MNNENFDLERNVAFQYLRYRKQILKYTNKDMNLTLNNDKQVYIALFDIPLQSGIVGFQTQSLALVFGLNTQIYHGSGSAVVGLEKHPEVMKAMQSLLISSNQVLKKMALTNEIEFYNSKYVRVYLKTKRGLYFKELKDNSKEDEFLAALMNYVLTEIAKTEKFDIQSNN